MGSGKARSRSDQAGNPMVRSMLDSAYRLQKTGSLDQSEVLYRRALQLEAGNPFALFGMGFIALSRQEFPQAANLLRQSWANGYRDETVLTHLGIALQASGRTSEALEAYREGARLDPRNPRYPSNAAVVLAQMGRPEEALEEARRAVRIGPKFAAGHLNTGNILLLLNRLPEARQAFETALALEPENAEVKAALAKLIAADAALPS